MVGSEAFQREGNGRVEIKDWFAAGKSDLQGLEVHMPYLQLCKLLHSSISSRKKVEKVLRFWKNLGKPLLKGGDEVGTGRIVCEVVKTEGPYGVSAKVHPDLNPPPSRR